MSLIADIKKGRAIKSYMVQLPQILAKDYGKSQYYTAHQVAKSIERSNLSTNYTPYAIAMFCEQPVFEDYYQELGETYDFEALRYQVADKHFQGNIHFTPATIAIAGSEFRESYFGGPPDECSFDSGCDGGGGDG